VVENPVTYTPTSGAETLRVGPAPNTKTIKKIGVIVFMRYANTVVAVLKKDNASGEIDFFGNNIQGMVIPAPPPPYPLAIETYARHAACVSSANTFIIQANLDSGASLQQYVEFNQNPLTQTEYARYYFVNIDVQDSNIIKNIEQLFVANANAQPSITTGSIVKIPLDNLIKKCLKGACSVAGAPAVQVNDAAGTAHTMHQDLQKCIIEFLNLPENATDILNKTYRVRSTTEVNVPPTNQKINSIIVNEKQTNNNNGNNNGTGTIIVPSSKSSNYPAMYAQLPVSGSINLMAGKPSSGIGLVVNAQTGQPVGIGPPGYSVALNSPVGSSIGVALNSPFGSPYGVALGGPFNTRKSNKHGIMMPYSWSVTP
jgi:hypothetical protein